MTPTETKVIHTIATFYKRNGGMMPLSMIREKTGLSPQSLRNINASLVEKGVLLHVSHGKYEFNGKFKKVLK